VRRLIESAHDEAYEVLVEYRDVLDDLVVALLEKETLTKTQVLEIFAPVVERPSRGSYTGYGKRQPSERPPVRSKKELAVLNGAEVQTPSVNGQLPEVPSTGTQGDDA
jgi:cell division protease FtsH